MKRILFSALVLTTAVFGCGDQYATCENDQDCKNGEFCGGDGYCAYECKGDGECSSNQYCDTSIGKCKDKKKDPPKKTCSQTCSGCCSGETCYPGTSRSHCGKSGKTCSSCSGSDICNAGYCGTCTSHSQCGSSEVCVTGTGCQAAFGRKWTILVTQAVINKKNYSSVSTGVDWDPAASPPDAYVEIKVGSSSVKSKYIDNTFTPKWDYSVDVTLNMGDAVSITVWEQDDWTADEFIGGVDYKSGVPIKTLQQGTVAWSPNDSTYGLQELYFKFSPK